VAEAVKTALPRSQITFTALEYGTVSKMEVLTALRADNWLHAVPNRQSALAQSIKEQIRAAFYAWKAAVFGRFADFTFRANRGLASRKVPGRVAGK
jgi:hypothetical protein